MVTTDNYMAVIKTLLQDIKEANFWAAYGGHPFILDHRSPVLPLLAELEQQLGEDFGFVQMIRLPEIRATEPEELFLSVDAANTLLSQGEASLILHPIGGVYRLLREGEVSHLFDFGNADTAGVRVKWLWSLRENKVTWTPNIVDDNGNIIPGGDIPIEPIVVDIGPYKA